MVAHFESLQKTKSAHKIVIFESQICGLKQKKFNIKKKVYIYA